MGLLRSCGLATGDRVVTLLPNSASTFALGMAAMLEGVVQVPLPTELGGDGLRTVIDDADPHLAVLAPGVDGADWSVRKAVHVGVHDDAWGDLVISGGVNVYPAEVERRLLADGAVAEAVVYGVKDREWDELAPAQVPRHIRVVDDLPRTPTGKVRRTGLAEALGGGA